MKSTIGGDRLTPMDRSKDLYPLRRANETRSSFLYWIPVTAFPIPALQRDWLMTFLDALNALVTGRLGLRTEVFLQYKSVMDLQRAFQRTAMEFGPIMGLSRRPGTTLESSPTMDDIAPVLEGRRKFDLKDWTPDYVYWFHNKSQRRQREEFFGYGGLTMISMKPDPKTVAPKLPFTDTFRKKHKIFQQVDVDSLVAGTFSLIDEFQAKSKELFASDLKQDPRYAGILFVLPILSAADFLERPLEECKDWFSLFDVYVRESPIDNGILLASKIDIEDQIIELLTEIRANGQPFPE